jgi:hypothetical protein
VTLFPSWNCSDSGHLAEILMDDIPLRQQRCISKHIQGHVAPEFHNNRTSSEKPPGDTMQSVTATAYGLATDRTVNVWWPLMSYDIVDYSDIKTGKSGA